MSNFDFNRFHRQSEFAMYAVILLIPIIMGLLIAYNSPIELEPIVSLDKKAWYCNKTETLMGTGKSKIAYESCIEWRKK